MHCYLSVHISILISSQALNTQPPTTTSAAQASTTRAPTTQASTTHAPTIRASTTLNSTTQFPTTRAPTSRAPTDWSKRIQTSTTNPVTSPTAGPTVFSCTYEPDNICFLRGDFSNSKSHWKREMVRHVTRQFFKRVRPDQCISKLFITQRN